MRWRPLIYLALSLAAVAGALAAAPTPPVANPNEPIVTRLNVFSIPFDRPKATTGKPGEVELRVSADLGLSWQFHAKAKPEQGNFVFRAPHDGEYWFALRTLDRAATMQPEAPTVPELKVIVDTVPPRLDLTATRGAKGELAIQWQIVDPNLNPDSLKVEVQSAPGEPWQRVGIAAPANRSRHTLTGNSTLPPQPGKGPIAVRAQVSDRAGNVASSQVQPKPGAGISGDKDKPGDPKLVDPRIGNANTPRGAEQPRTATASKPAESPGDTEAARRWLADASTSVPLGRREPPAVSSDPHAQVGSDGGWRAPTQESPPRPSTPAIHASTPARTSTSGKPVSANSENRGAASTLDTSLLPSGEHPRMVNARSFDLEYEIDSVGTSGIAKVELWGTRDGGQTWSSFGLDTDNRSPVRVNVDGEGIYGFRIVVQSGSGLGGLPPRNGDLPEIWVGVDLTSPTARIISAAIQPDTSELLIRWEAGDEMLEPRPISLAFGEHPNGPWSPIASGLENTGSYSWRLDNRAPDKIYVRLEARDEAGNASVVVTSEPVSLDRQRPQGRIRGIRPAGQPAPERKTN